MFYERNEPRLRDLRIEQQEAADFLDPLGRISSPVSDPIAGHSRLEGHPSLKNNGTRMVFDLKALPERLALFWRRRSSANRLGLSFSRSATFKLPELFDLNETTVTLSLPQEHGVRVAFIELLLDDCYELNWLKRQKESIVRVLDIGANVGIFSLAARSAFPGATIHAYEPNRALEAHLNHQAKAADARVFFEAVGRDDGTIRLVVLDENESVHTASQLDEAGSIPQVSLRSAIDRMGGTVDLLKIDCEGAEWDMLEDIEPWRRVRHVTMEYHLRDGLDHGSVQTALRRCGFVVRHQVRADTFGLVFASNSGQAPTLFEIPLHR
jgi:FkbM family methyltransferase